MSMIKCDECDVMIDSDEDLDCFVCSGRIVLCLLCREEIEPEFEIAPTSEWDEFV